MAVLAGHRGQTDGSRHDQLAGPRAIRRRGPSSRAVRGGQSRRPGFREPARADRRSLGRTTTCGSSPLRHRHLPTGPPSSRPCSRCADRGVSRRPARSASRTPSSPSATRWAWTPHAARPRPRVLWCVPPAGGETGWAESVERDITRCDAAALVEGPRTRRSRRRTPKAWRRDHGRSFCEPAAVAELLGLLSYCGFGALAEQEGQSFLSGRLGEKITGEEITIVDDAADERTVALPFDFEGVPRHRVPLITDGVAVGVVHDSYTAARAGTAVHRSRAARPEHSRAVGDRPGDVPRRLEPRRPCGRDGQGAARHQVLLHESAGPPAHADNRDDPGRPVSGSRTARSPGPRRT